MRHPVLSSQRLQDEIRAVGSMPKHYRSDARAAVHETMAGLVDAGVLDQRTMKAFHAMCLSPVTSSIPADHSKLGVQLPGNITGAESQTAGVKSL